MKCPYCSKERDKVIDSRMSKEGDAIRRRRQCLTCGSRFTTYERIDEVPYMVVKKGGRRERFDRHRVLNGVVRACAKRPVPMRRIQEIVEKAEALVAGSSDRECPSGKIGQLVMHELRHTDRVAYVRFASVFLDFQDEHEFQNEVERLDRGPLRAAR